VSGHSARCCARSIPGQSAVADREAVAYISPMTEPQPNPFSTFHPFITEENIALLVRTFYGRAREDDLIGPIFNAAVADWDHHLAQISDFWSSMMMKTGRYNGRPMRPHLVLPLTVRTDRAGNLSFGRCRGLYHSRTPHRRQFRDGRRLGAGRDRQAPP
jgi:hypothetical protein